MDHEGNVRDAAAETALFEEVVGAGPMDARVPSCPAWDVAGLAEHVGTFLGWWTHVVCEGTGREKPTYADQPPADAHPDRWTAWLSERRAALVEVFGEAAPTDAIWTWYEPEQTVAFAARRVANELAVHRYDAQLARGLATPIDVDRAACVVDELEIIVRQNGDLSNASGETIHLHATDGGGEWMLQFDPDSFAMRREHAKGDLALRGTVSDLALFLYGRPTIGEVEQLGDPEALDAWHRAWPWV